MREKAAPPAIEKASGPSDRRSKVTDEHRHEAAKLRKLFESYVTSQAERGVKVTQSGFAGDNQIGTQGMLWQYLNARSPLNLKVALRFAQALGVKVQQFSPRLAEEQATLAPAGAIAGPKTALQSVLELSPLEQQLVGLCRDLHPDQQHELVQMANALHAKTHTAASTANPYGEKTKTKARERDAAKH